MKTLYDYFDVKKNDKENSSQYINTKKSKSIEINDKNYLINMKNKSKQYTYSKNRFKLILLLLLLIYVIIMIIIPILI